MKIVFLTRGLMRGGAERQLALLACGLAVRGHQVAVLTFYPGGAFLAELAAADVRVINLGKTGRWDLIGFWWRLIRTVRGLKPDVLHSYLAVPNVLAALLRPFVKPSKIVWGIRSSNMDLALYDRLSGYAYRVERLLSGLPDMIICNSAAGKDFAVKRGYPAAKFTIIPNGIDTGAFRFDQSGRERLRRDWSIADGTLLVGVVARYDPMKDHQNFLAAAEQVAARRDDVRFVCIGDGIESLSETALAGVLGSRLLCLPASDEVAAVYSALDIVCSSSISGEGFSNSIAEAMACARTCVVTEVGDSAWIVAGAGLSVAPGNSPALAEGIVAALDGNLAETGAKSRERIVLHFSLEALVRSSERAFAGGYQD